MKKQFLLLAMVSLVACSLNAAFEEEVWDEPEGVEYNSAPVVPVADYDVDEGFDEPGIFNDAVMVDQDVPAVAQTGGGYYDQLKSEASKAKAAGYKEIQGEVNNFKDMARQIIEDQKKELRKEQEKFMKVMMQMVIQFLHKKLPGMVRDLVVGSVSSVKSRVGGWLGYGEEPKVVEVPDEVLTLGNGDDDFELD